jgi:hypothetical protein
MKTFLLSLSLTNNTGAITHGVAGDPTLPGSYPVHKLFFRFGGGRPLQKVNFLISRNPLGVPTTCFAILRLKISYKISILGRSCSLAPGSFIPVSLRSCCLRSRFLMPFLHSGPVKRLLSSFRRFGVSCSVWLLVQSFLTNFSLGHAILAWRVIFIPAVVNVLRGPQFFSKISLAPCHCSTAGHLPASGSQLLPGSTITWG